MRTHYDQLATHFDDKISQLWSDLDSTVLVVSDVPSARVGGVLWDQFQLLQSADVDKVLQVYSLGFPPGFRFVLLKAQVDTLARSAFYQLHLLQQLWPFLGGESLTTVVHALVP